MGHRARSTLDLSPPKARLPGKDESQPAVGEGGCPFEPGRVRDDLVLRARWESTNPERLAASGPANGDSPSWTSSLENQWLGSQPRWVSQSRSFAGWVSPASPGHSLHRRKSGKRTVTVVR